MNRPSAVAGLVLTLLGLGDSIYLAYEHATANATLACGGHGTVDCAKVTTSSSVGPPFRASAAFLKAGLTSPIQRRRVAPVVQRAVRADRVGVIHPDFAPVRLRL